METALVEGSSHEHSTIMRAEGSITPSKGRRSTPDTPSSEAPSSNSAPDSEDEVVAIVDNGDVVLQIEHTIDTSVVTRSFRASSSMLKTNSKYFSRLLQPQRFSEAADVENTHRTLRDKYANVADAPIDELPVLKIHDVGRVQVRSIGPLLTDFLNIVHGKDTQASLPAANLANLAIVADRFDAIERVKSYVGRKKLLRAIDGKTTAKAETALGEDKVRQRLLVGLMFDDHTWVEKYSLRLVTKGWVGVNASSSTALWWDLPLGIEEELAHRRDCILETVQSLQAHFLGLYLSRERQCKLGYDSSPQCDSFQLGEMMRFFTRVGTLQFQGTIIETNEPPAPFAGDIKNLLDTLRQVPEYQIDRFHTHCGIRTRLVPILQILEFCITQAGVCAQCWSGARPETAWLGAKPPLLWRRSGHHMRDGGHKERHAGTREMFTASEHDWS